MANKKYNNASMNSDEVGRLIKMVVIVTVVFLLFYAVTLIVTKEKKQEVLKTPATIQYKEILLGNILKQPNDNYYVLAFAPDDAYSIYYETKLDGKKVKYYKVNIDNPLNSNFVSDKSNLNVSDITDLKVSQSTLFEIKNKKIIKTYEGNEKIIEYLDSLK